DDSLKAWQDIQRACPLNRSQPRLADSEIAFLSPAIKRSKGELPESCVRSNEAMALAIVSMVMPSLPKAAANKGLYSPRSLTLPTTIGWSFIPISMELMIGNFVCSSMVGAR